MPKPLYLDNFYFLSHYEYSYFVNLLIKSRPPSMLGKHSTTKLHHDLHYSLLYLSLICYWYYGSFSELYVNYTIFKAFRTRENRLKAVKKKKAVIEKLKQYILKAQFPCYFLFFSFLFFFRFNDAMSLVRNSDLFSQID